MVAQGCEDTEKCGHSAQVGTKFPAFRIQCVTASLKTSRDVAATLGKTG